MIPQNSLTENRGAGFGIPEYHLSSLPVANVQKPRPSIILTKPTNENLGHQKGSQIFCMKYPSINHRLTIDYPSINHRLSIYKPYIHHIFRHLSMHLASADQVSHDLQLTLTACGALTADAAGGWNSRIFADKKGELIHMRWEESGKNMGRTWEE